MSLAKQLSEDRDARIWAASYDAHKNAVRVAMQDGRIYLLKRPIPEDDGSEILELFLEGDGEIFTVIQASGNEFSVPWDAVSNIAKDGGDAGGGSIGKRIGQRVKTLRKTRGLTQAQLAAGVGLQRPNISRLETGAHAPSILLLERLAEALHVKIIDLITE